MHVVRAGETTSSIASRHQITTSALLAANPHKPVAWTSGILGRNRVFASLTPGEQIRIPARCCR